MELLEMSYGGLPRYTIKKLCGSYKLHIPLCANVQLVCRILSSSFSAAHLTDGASRTCVECCIGDMAQSLRIVQTVLDT